jgi:hypothetical protein
VGFKEFVIIFESEKGEISRIYGSMPTYVVTMWVTKITRCEAKKEVMTPPQIGLRRQLGIPGKNLVGYIMAHSVT